MHLNHDDLLVIAAARPVARLLAERRTRCEYFKWRCDLSERTAARLGERIDDLEKLIRARPPKRESPR